MNRENILWTNRNGQIIGARRRWIFTHYIDVLYNGYKSPCENVSVIAKSIVNFVEGPVKSWNLTPYRYSGKKDYFWGLLDMEHSKTFEEPTNCKLVKEYYYPKLYGCGPMSDNGELIGLHNSWTPNTGMNYYMVLFMGVMRCNDYVSLTCINNYDVNEVRAGYWREGY